MGRIEKYIHPHWGFIGLTVLIKLAAACLELLIPYLMEIILDVKVPAGERNQIYLFGGLMLLCAAGCLGGNILANRMSAVSSGRITRAIRHDLFQKLENLSARQMDELTVSSAESRLTSDTYNINQLLARIQRMGIRAPILLLGGLAMTMSMDPVLSLILLGLLPIIAVVVYFVTKTSVPLYTRQQSVLDKVVRVVQENITGIRVIKALSKTDHERRRFHRVNQELSAVEQKASIITAITNPTATLVMNLGLTLVVVAGAYRVNSGAIKSGVIVAFLQYFTLIINAMLGVTRIFVMWSKGEASANRVADVLATPEDLKVEVPDQTPVIPGQSADWRGNSHLKNGSTIEGARETTPGCASDIGHRRAITEKNGSCFCDEIPHIEFRDVTFSYTGIGENLDHLSFKLCHGQTLGILGPTGSGKSTILNLLMRLYDPDEGQIFLDGQDIRTLDKQTLCSKFGVVFQNDFITEGTIGKNIAFFRGIPRERCLQAGEDAQAAFIHEKEGGMDAAVVVRGNNLSGGQKQRLLIARALAGNPEILVLDDASSALDYQTDAQLRRALRKNYRSTTTVLVAQRVSSLRHADLILMLEDGKVTGQGDHDTLMATCPEYRIIAQTQMGDGKEGA